MSRPVLSEFDLSEVLRELGGTCDEVAERLRAAGFTGECGSASSCPVAKWLLAETGLRHVAVDTGRYGIYGREPGNGQGFFADAPEPVEQFIVRFDEGDYPDLIEAGQS